MYRVPKTSRQCMKYYLLYTLSRHSAHCLGILYIANATAMADVEAIRQKTDGKRF